MWNEGIVNQNHVKNYMFCVDKLCDNPFVFNGLAEGTIDNRVLYRYLYWSNNISKARYRLILDY